MLKHAFLCRSALIFGPGLLVLLLPLTVVAQREHTVFAIDSAGKATKDEGVLFNPAEAQETSTPHRPDNPNVEQFLGELSPDTELPKQFVAIPGLRFDAEAKRRDKHILIVDGKEGPAFDDIRLETSRFAAVKRRLIERLFLPFLALTFPANANSQVPYEVATSKMVDRIPGSAQPSRTQANPPSSTSPSRWSLRAFVAVGENLGGGDLQRKPSPELDAGTIFITSTGTTAYEVDADYRLARFLVLRSGYQTATLDFGTDHYNGPGSIAFRSLSIGSARVHIPRFGVFGIIHDADSENKTMELGLFAGPQFYTNVKSTTAARDLMGIQQITPTRGFAFGGELGFSFALGQTGLWLGGTMSAETVDKGELRITSDPNGRYGSGSADFRALLFGVTVGYHFH